MKAIDSLCDQPLKGAYEPWLARLKMGHRRLLVGNFKVVYRVLKTKVIVVDIFDARQDPKRMLG
jgi:plasmid stabilization system protein ParE